MPEFKVASVGRISEAELVALVLARIPQRLLHAAVLALARANRDAQSACSVFAGPEREDTYGHVLRAFFEQYVRHDASDIQGVTAKVQKNHRKTSSFTEIRTSGIAITASAVPSPGQMPRDADFRNNRSRSSQFSLFAEQDAPSGDDVLYVVLTYCADDAGNVFDARLVVPDHTGKRRLAEVPLTQHLEAAIAELDRRPAEEQISEPQPGLRKPAKKAKKQES